MSSDTPTRYRLIADGGVRVAEAALHEERLLRVVRGIDYSRDRFYDAEGAPLAWVGAELFWRTRRIPHDRGFVALRRPGAQTEALDIPNDPRVITAEELGDERVAALRGLGVEEMPLRATLDVFRVRVYGRAFRGGKRRATMEVSVRNRRVAPAGESISEAKPGSAEVLLRHLRGDPKWTQHVYESLAGYEGLEARTFSDYADAIRDYRVASGFVREAD